MSLGNWGQSFLQDAAAGFFGNEYLRDYTHASKTFRTNSYQNAPKFKFLFHVYFDINPEAFSQGISTGFNFGLAVKSVKLPSFTFDVTQMNQYNRKRLVQTKIKYDPIDITFHDDNGNQINQLWFNYFTYYYKDSTKPQVIFAGNRGGKNVTPNATSQNPATDANYFNRNIYSDKITGNTDWGYIGESSVPSESPNQQKVPFFKNITVFGFNQHNFTAYTLVNPIITRFGHDTYAYSESNGTMENTMGIDYETVVYNTGAIDGRKPSDIVTGFGMNENYDRNLSPIARPGANGTILGKGGLIDAVGGAIQNISEGNYVGAIRTAGTAYNTFKNANLTQIAKSDVKNTVYDSVNKTPNRNQLFSTPIFGSTPSPTGTAGSPTPGVQNNTTATTQRTAGKQT